MLEYNSLASPANLSQLGEPRRSAVARRELNRESILAHHGTMLVVDLNFSLQHSRTALTKPSVPGYHFRHFALVKFFDF
jgi:hypothetical protein